MKKNRLNCHKKKKRKALNSFVSFIHGKVLNVTPRGKSKKLANLQGLQNSKHEKKARPPGLKVLKPISKSFVKSVNCYTYWLKNNFQWYNWRNVSRTEKLMKTLRFWLKGTDSDEINPVSILEFLKEFRDVCDSID